MLTSRDYTDGDYSKHIQSLTKCNMKAFFVDNFGGWSDSVSEKKFFEIVKNGFVRLFFLDETFVGYVSFNLEKDFSDSYLINDIHIVHGFRRKGYGSSILSYVIDKAKSKGINQLRVFVFEKNPSINFYKKHGFEEIEFLEKSNTSVMRKKLK